MNTLARLLLSLGSIACATTAAACAGSAPAGALAAPPAGSTSASAAVADRPPAHPVLVGSVSSSVDPDKKLQAVVYLEDAPPVAGALQTATVDVKGKVFSPGIAVVSAGGTVTFGNLDALTHHVFSPDVPNWDTGYLQKDGKATHAFPTAGAYALLCNIHPEMIGYVLVIPSTSYARLRDDGKYAMTGVAPGTYRATAWAPHMQPASQSVTIGAGSVATANFVLKAQ